MRQGSSSCVLTVLSTTVRVVASDETFQLHQQQRATWPARRTSPAASTARSSHGSPSTLRPTSWTAGRPETPCVLPPGRNQQARAAAVHAWCRPGLQLSAAPPPPAPLLVGPRAPGRPRGCRPAACLPAAPEAATLTRPLDSLLVWHSCRCCTWPRPRRRRTSSR